MSVLYLGRLFAIVSSTAKLEADHQAAVVDLRCQLPEMMLGIGPERLRLTWRVSPAIEDLVQLAYEIQTSSTPGFEALLATSGVVESSDQIALEAPGDAMHSREVRFARVRISTARGWTAWGPVLRVEAGLLETSDWVARAVTLPDDPGAKRQAPSPILRREFEVAAEVVRARLYVTSLGVNRVTINGTLVSDELLNPGWSTYGNRLLAATHDVTPLLAPGPNVIAGVLGDGWYRGRLGWDPADDRCRYGTELGLIAQLELEQADGTSQRIVTDETWLASTGEILSADLYDGSVIDLREQRDGWDLPGYDTSEWQQAIAVPFESSRIEPRMAQPVRPVVVMPVEPVGHPNGSVRLDGGQNIAGFVRLKVKGQRGDRITVRHAEVLEPDGSLHVRSLRSAKATDIYTLANDQSVELEPAFTFHGFRYAEIVSDAEILSAEFIAISSDTPRRGRFECSDQSLNRFHENVVWSQRDNFVSVPTDCPQRDERLGWTGDAQAFAPTASLLFDAQAFWESWLTDLALDQDDELGVSTVVPDVVLDGEPRYGRAGWADAATIVPWAVYEAYGDSTVLRRQFDSMRRWVDSLRSRQESDGLLGSSMQFGDWLDPDAPPDKPWMAKTNSDFLANSFFAHSARLVAGAASMLGDEASAREYRALTDQVASRTWVRWADHAVTTQTGCAVALQFQIAPESNRPEVADALARQVREAHGRVATGFLGTPLVLPALAEAGFFDEAYSMLLRHDPPSWLYQVDQGATTVWERWDAIRPDGSIHPGTMSAPPEMVESDDREGHMLSFNHYAYGAVIDWVYRHVAGIAPDVTQPGYRNVVFAPKPAVGIDWARASVDTAFGPVASAWNLEDAGPLSVEIDLPFGSSGRFVAPVTQASIVLVDGVAVSEEIRLSPGHHSIKVTHPRVANGHLATMPANTSPAGAADF